MGCTVGQGGNLLHDLAGPGLFNDKDQRNRICINLVRRLDPLLAQIIQDPVQGAVLDGDPQPGAQAHADFGRVVQGVFGGFGIGPDQSPGAQQGAAEITGDHDQDIGAAAAVNDLEDGQARGPGRLAVVRRPGLFLLLADDPGVAVVPGVIIFLTDLLQKGNRFFFGFHMDCLGDKTGFFLHIFALSVFVDGQIFSGHLLFPAFSAVLSGSGTKRYKSLN